MNDWISVRDKLPRNTKHGVRCLVTYRAGSGRGIHVFEAVFGGGEWRFPNIRFEMARTERVTHWMLMPKPARRTK